MGEIIRAFANFLDLEFCYTNPENIENTLDFRLKFSSCLTCAPLLSIISDVTSPSVIYQLAEERVEVTPAGSRKKIRSRSRKIILQGKRCSIGMMRVEYQTSFHLRSIKSLKMLFEGEREVVRWRQRSEWIFRVCGGGCGELEKRFKSAQISATLMMPVSRVRITLRK